MRRLAAVLGIVLLVGGIVAAIMLLMLGPRYRDRQIDQMARAAVGCTTPLVFTDAGEFWVFEEVVSPKGAGTPECPAVASDTPFGFDLAGDPSPIVEADDGTAAYDSAGALATSVAQITIESPGTYRLTVHGPLDDVVAAVGPDPNDIVDSYRRAALIAGIAGVVLGVAALTAAARRRPPGPDAVPTPVATTPWPAPVGAPVGSGATGAGAP